MDVPKRLGRDLQAMMSKDLREMGIYYSYDDADVRKGTALLFGPPETPYANCPLIFSVDIPMDYPFLPPKVLIQTSDNATRFHPNLYIEGKVCLSILGTYSGPKWASTMSLETVFKSIHSLLNDNPITNEPGWEGYTLEDEKARTYRDWVTFRLAAYTVQEAVRWSVAPKGHLWAPFEDVFAEVWSAHWKELRTRIQAMAEAHPSPVMCPSIPYGMRGTIDWPALATRLQQIKLEG